MHCPYTPKKRTPLLTQVILGVLCGLLVLWCVYRGNADAEGLNPQPPRQITAPRVDSYTITQRGDGYRVNISYPQTGNPVADAELAIWAQEQAAAFTDAVRLIPTPPPIPYELSISHETVLTPSRIFSIVFFISTAMGGPHPEPGLATFTYDKRDGRRLSYADLFMSQEGLTQTFSDICHEALSERLGNRAVESMLKAGTAPDMANFDLFVLVKEGIRIYFPPYQAASYSEGYLDVSIPLGELVKFKPHLAFWDQP